jgi:hypothetical protein
MRKLILFMLYIVLMLFLCSPSSFAQRESFTRLRDAPQSYKDQAGKCVTVKDNETGLEFEDCGTGGGAPTDAHYFTDRAEDGLSAEIVASTIGKAVATSTNPGAIRFGRANADNTFTWLSDSDFRTAIGVIDWTADQGATNIHSGNIPTLNQNTTGTAGGLADAFLIIEAEGISSNDNDTSVPSSAAVKAYADSVAQAVDQFFTSLGDSTTIGLNDGSTYPFISGLSAVDTINELFAAIDANMASDKLWEAPPAGTELVPGESYKLSIFDADMNSRSKDINDATDIAANDSNPDTFDSTTTDFIAAGYVAGDRIKATGFTNAANNTEVIIASVSQHQLVFNADAALTTEAAGNTIDLVGGLHYYSKYTTNLNWVAFQLENGDFITTEYFNWVIPIAPGPAYDLGANYFITEVDAVDFPNGILIDSWKMSCDVNPDIELNADLRRADAWIGLANAADIDEIDTSDGVSSETNPANINGGAAIAVNQILYIGFDADPATSTCKQAYLKINGHSN